MLGVLLAYLMVVLWLFPANPENQPTSQPPAASDTSKQGQQS
jgi:hypothetical protein